MVNRAKTWLTCILVIGMVDAGAHAAPSSETISRPAVFRVTADIVNRDMLPFNAIIGGFGNSLIREGAGFEPVVFRNKLIALEDSPDRIVATPDSMTIWDTLREGFLDQATVHTYRIENGRFRMVREDKVATGGAHASGWLRALADNQVIARGTTRFSFRWESWSRPRAKYYFTVRAIDKYGSLSPAAPAVEIESPEKLDKAPAAQNALVAFKPARALFSSPKPPPTPRGLRGKLGGDGILTLEWEMVDSPDLAGYVVYRSDHPPQQHGGYYLRLAGTPKSADQNIRAGDMVIVSKKLYSPSRSRDLSNRVWKAASEYEKLMPGLLRNFPDEIPGITWSLVPHAANTPVEEPGETCLKLQLAAGTKETLALFNHSGTGQHWYDVLEKKTYKVEVWLRQEGSGTVQFRVGGFYSTAPQKIKPVIFSVGRDWKKYVAHFTPSVVQGGTRANAMMLEFTGPATFYVDNFRVYRADTAYLDTLPHELERIKSSGISTVRTSGLVMTGIHTYDMEQLTNSGGVINGTRKLSTLPQTLKMLRKAGVQPWLQIEFHMSPREWLGFVEYMAAPYDPKVDTHTSKPWAYKRSRQGQTRPWVEEFDRIYLELSNETWNRIFAPWTFTPMNDAVSKKRYSAGQVYGLFQEYVHSILRSSPYWRPADLDNKFSFMLGGWAANTAYGYDAASVSPSSDYLTIAPYIGGWDAAEGPPEPNAASLFSTLAYVNQSAIPVADRYAKELPDLKTKGARRLRLGTYEGGPGYVMDGLNNARVTKEQALAQEQVMKSLAAGTATLDTFLALAYRGFALQNFFALGEGDRWKSHAKWYHGGQAYPSWKLITLFNNEATGDMLRTETVSVPSVDLKAFSRRLNVKDAPLAGIYATRKGNRYSLFVLSRKIPNYPVKSDDGYTPVTVELPFSEAKSVTLYRMTGAPDANNLLGDNVRIEKLEIPASKLGQRFSVNAETGADKRGLPPASTFLYVFDGVSAGKSTAQSPKK
jgi:hypothetical protein